MKKQTATNASPMIHDHGAAFEYLENLRRLYGRTRSERVAHARTKGTHTKDEWKTLHDIFGHCVACGIPYSELNGGKASKDHIHPVFCGGCDCIANLQPVCRQCNSTGRLADMRENALPGWQTIYLHRIGTYF
jgi:hypothetical protein